MSSRTKTATARRVNLTSLRHRVADMRQLLRSAPLANEEHEFIAQMIECLDVALDEYLTR